MKAYIDKTEKCLTCETCKNEYIKSGDATEAEYKEVDPKTIPDLVVCRDGNYNCACCDYDFDGEHNLTENEELEKESDRADMKRTSRWLDWARR